MPTSNIPVGLNYVDVRRRAGILTSTKMVIKNTMCLSDFFLIDEWLQVNVKNFGQISQFQSKKSEVFIFRILQSKSVFDCCQDFSIVPISINDVPYHGDELLIDFELIVGMLPNGRYCDIWASTNPIQKQLPVKYTVGFSVTELWEYIVDCSCPSV